MRKQLVIAAGLAAASAGGCGVGDGTGSAKGDLFMVGCLEGGDYGEPGAPIAYDLSPSYFVGEPIEDISDARPAANQLTIRLQRNGNALEITDTLYFQIPSSYDVATCLRGQTINGVPQWDTTSTGTLVDLNAPPWCEAPVPVAMGGTGLPRIHLVPAGPVRVSFTPLNTCASKQHPPAIVSITGVARDGWIDFQDFGTAMDNSVPSDMRTGVGNDFKVDFGQRLRASFHADMDDDRVQTALRMMVDPPRDPTIGGTLDGDFDFDLSRGQGAQSFP